MSELTKPDFPVRGVIGVLIACFAMVAIAIAAIYLIYPGARRDRVPRPSDFGQPALETAPVQDYDAWRAKQADLLEGAGGRMTIDAAMDEIAARGKDAFAPLPERGTSGGEAR